MADTGIDLAPADAIATRLRLEGNVAITRTWLTGSADAVVAECERIASEAAARGLEHIAAIAYHNAGEAQLRAGTVDEAIASLERAAAFWRDPPTSPFADNSDLVKALVMGGQHAKARAVATEALRRTKPWMRSNADAASGMAAVMIADGEFEEAIDVLGTALRDRAALGNLEVLLVAQRIDALYLSGAAPDAMARATEQLAKESMTFAMAGRLPQRTRWLPTVPAHAAGLAVMPKPSGWTAYAALDSPVW